MMCLCFWPGEATGWSMPGQVILTRQRWSRWGVGAGSGSVALPEDGGELGGSMIMVRWIERLGEKGRGERKLGTKESDPGPQRVWHRV